MTLVFDHYPVGGGEYALALALADNADDSGGSIFPSVATLAHKSRQSERTVQRQLRAMEEAGWLQCVEPGGGRRKSSKYRIDPAWIAAPGSFKPNNKKGDILSPFPEPKGCHDGVTISPPETVTKSPGNGDTAMSPEPSLLNHHNPPIPPFSMTGSAEPSDGQAEEEKLDRELAQWMLGRLRRLNPKHADPNWKRWVREIRLMRERDRRTRREIAELFAWANGDDFWQTNILSPGKLRERWDQLVIKRSAAKPLKPPEPTVDYRCAGVDAGARCGRQGVRSKGNHQLAEWYCARHWDEIERLEMAR